MGYPVWITEVGDLGKISSQQFFNVKLDAYDPDNGDIEFKLIAGQLPKGVQIASNGFISGNPEATYTLQGVPFSTNIDVDSVFTIRAINVDDGSITDRTFKLTVTGNFKPVITTIADPLGTYLDGTEISLQLEATDLNNDPLEWNVISGSLPKGLTLSKSGLISGIIEPSIYEFSTDIVGWNNSKWNNASWEFETVSNNKSYEFTVAVNDTKAVTYMKYKINVFAFNDLRADTTSIYADSTIITADIYPDRPPILITKTLGNFQKVNSGGYYAFKFDAIDWDIAEITYVINTGLGLGWDEGTNQNWDMIDWDRGEASLPPGLHLDSKTGWLTGYIPTQEETTKDYNFGISVQSTNRDTTIESNIRYFTLTILGNLDLAINWVTPENLGSIFVGSTSNQTVAAVAASGRELTYRLAPTFTIDGITYGSKLPQGLTLLNNGHISGRVSFQLMGFDKGKTTFDKTLASKFVYSDNINFDNVYRFSIVANDFANQLSGEQIFTIRVIPSTYEPYENLYIKCLPSANKRLALTQIINNTDIIDPADIYRPNDPYYGVSNEIRILASYGIKASELGHKTSYALIASRTDDIATLTTTNDHGLSIGDTITVKITQGDATFNAVSKILDIPELNQISYENPGIDVDIMITDPGYDFTGTVTKMNTYIESMMDRHYKKKFYFGDYKVAQGKDLNGNWLYDVLYVDLIEDTKVYNTETSVVKNKIPASFTTINNVKPKWRNYRASALAQNQLYSSSSSTVDKTYIKANDTFFPFEPLNKIAPNDLTLMQKDIALGLENSYLNSLPEWMVSVQTDGRILGYTSGAPLAYLKPGTGAKALFNMKKYAPSDIKDIPFVVDRYILDNKYTENFDLKARKFASHKYTTFNLTSSVGVAITPVFKADFAVDRPFDSINLQTLEYIIETGGLDGITYNLDGKYLIFATQEAYTGWGSLINDGWNFYNDVIVPGYAEKLVVPTLKNQRGGIWQIKINSDNIIELSFVREINTGEYIYVIEGVDHGNGYLLYDITALVQGYTVPKYTQTYSQVLEQSFNPTTFDKGGTNFINNIDSYTLPMQGAKYLKFPKIGVFTNGQ